MNVTSIVSFAHNFQLAWKNDELPDLNVIVNQAFHHNHWFTKEFVTQRIDTVLNYWSSEKFVSDFAITFPNFKNKTFAILAEEHIPMQEVGLVMTLLFSGGNVIYKLSPKSDKVLPFFFHELAKAMPYLADRIRFEEGVVKGFDRLIATRKEDNDATLRQYLQKHPSKLIARNQSVAILDGTETMEELQLLANDIFAYFGLGAGNVRKVYVPENYNLNMLFGAIEHKHEVSQHNAFANNYQYHQSVYLMNRIQHLDNGFILLKEDRHCSAPSGVLFYEYYKDLKTLAEELELNSQVYAVYYSEPVTRKHRYLGSSINQLLEPERQIINSLA